MDEDGIKGGYLMACLTATFILGFWGFWGFLGFISLLICAAYLALDRSIR